jgi:hypothetical protein
MSLRHPCTGCPHNKGYDHLFLIAPIIGPNDVLTEDFAGYEVSFSDGASLTKETINDVYERIAGEMLKGYKDE